jgi:hypothetical protein
MGVTRAGARIGEIGQGNALEDHGRGRLAQCLGHDRPQGSLAGLLADARGAQHGQQLAVVRPRLAPAQRLVEQGAQDA